ncbi:esterase [Streptosporangium violaceochromogenes]|nr:esterase [Streptosporangium violaceochromogenes]
MDDGQNVPGWASALDGELVQAAVRQPYVAFTDPLAARRNFARATRLSRALRGVTYDPEGVDVDHLVLRVPEDGHELTVRRYVPGAVPAPRPAMVYFHGGAFVAGDLDTEHDRCLRFAAEAGCAVFSVEYRRPPDHPFPVPVKDCLAAVEWIAAEAGALDVDSRLIAVGGSSAGATLAAAVALLCRDRGGPEPVLQMLLYPALDNRLDSDSMAAYPRVTSWTIEDSALMWRHYLGDDPRAASSAYAVPARRGDFTGVAPAYVLVAEVDALRDEAIDYAVRMMGDGVPVELHHLAGTFHGFDAAAPAARVSQRSLAGQSAALRAAFRRAEQASAAAGGH